MMRHRVTLESSGYIPGVGLADDGELPSDPIIKESLSLVLENSCLLCDIVLRFKLYKENKFFPVWFQNRLISDGLEPVFNLTDNQV